MKTAPPFVNINERVYNNPSLKARRKELRQKSTKAEKLLWDVLREKRLGGWKFRRQHSVGSYVLDFYCPKARLNVEVDGSQHFTEQGKLDDAVRDQYLKSMRINVLRFENVLVEKNIDFVLTEILSCLRTSPNPSLAKKWNHTVTEVANKLNGEVELTDRSNLPLTPSLAKEGEQLRCGNVNVGNGEVGTKQQ